MIRATDMILAAQRTVYDGLPTFANTRSMVHVADVANVVHDSRVTREQNDNPYYVEHLDYHVSLCTVAQEVRKLRQGRKVGRYHARFMIPYRCTYQIDTITAWVLTQLGMKAR